MIEIGIPEENAWQSFEHLARREGWTVPAWEIDLYRRHWPDSAAVLLDDGEPRGFVTVVAFGRLGWIGNLIVDKDCRGRGFGRQLFSHALESLERKRCSAAWLTASAQGRPLYEGFGFRSVDRVERWMLEGKGTAHSGSFCLPKSGLGDLVAADRAVWGAGRKDLFSALGRGGDLLSTGQTVVLLQAGEGLRVLGPWFSPTQCPRENRAVLAQAMAKTGSGTMLVADVLASSAVKSLFSAAGFVPSGGCDLMARGKTAGTRLDSVVAFASLGSLG